MVKFLDQYVVDWQYYTWNYNGAPIQQVMFHLFNGMTFIMDEEDFFALSDYEAL